MAYASPPPPPPPPAHLTSRSGSRSRSASRFRRLLSLRWLRRFETPEWQNALLVLALAVVVALAIRVSEAAPTGLDVMDAVWVGAFTAVGAYFAGYARRWTWFLPAGLGAFLAADRLALGCAAAAIVLAFVSVWVDSRSRPFAALVVGLAMVSLQNLRLGAGPVEVPEEVQFQGITAIAVAVSVLPIVHSGYKLAGRTARKRINQVAAWASALLVLALAGAAIGIMTVFGDLGKGMNRVDDGVQAARQADDEQAALRLGEAARHLHSAETTLTSWFVQPAHGLPFVGPNIRAVSDMARDTAEATKTSAAAAATAELDHLRFEDGRLDPRRLQNMIPALSDVAESATGAQETVEQAKSPWLVGPVRSRLDRLEGELQDNLPDLDNARKAVEVAAPLIGGDGPRRYLVLFTTPVEGRGRTGFPGNYAELTFEDGKLEMPMFGRISDLEQGGDPAAREITGPADFLSRYGRFDPQTTWRNLTMSPDFPTIAYVAMQLYPQSGGQPVDGVLSVDPTGLAALMHFTGPVDIEGVGTLDADNVERFLHLDQYVTFADAQGDRTDFLEDVAEATFNRLTDADLPKPSEVIDILGPAVKGNHIQFTTEDLVEFSYLGEIGVNGALASTETGDNLAVTTTNAGASKIDAFLSRRLDYEVIWDPASGRVDAKVTATLTNTAPSEGLPPYVIGNDVDLPSGFNRSFVSIYSPWMLREARIDGEAAGLQPERELDRYAYSAFVDIPPGESVVVELDLTGSWMGAFYPLTLSPAPLVSDEQATVTVTVAGDQDLTVSGEEGWALDGRTARWEGLLNEPRQMAVSIE